MPSAYQFNVTYDEVGNTIHGLVFAHATDFLISPIQVLTYGFVYGLADIWVDADDCQNVTWTSADSC